MALEQRITDLITPSLNDLGYYLVRIKILTGKSIKLQIMIERMDEMAISIKDCTRVSRHLSALFDVEDIIDDRYNLEVSSPGLDRPLVKPEDFTRFLGLVAQLRLKNVILNEKQLETKKIEGRITARDNDEITITIEPPKKKKNIAPPPYVLVIHWENIDAAKLAFNDELIKLAENGTLPGSKQPSDPLQNPNEVEEEEETDQC